MPSKRKGAAPKRADNSKQEKLSWNMLDLNHGVNIIGDDDPDLLRERREAERLLAEAQQYGSLTEYSASHHGTTNGTSGFQPSSVIGHSSFIDDCEFYLTVMRNLQLKSGEWSCVLGKLILKLNMVMCADSNILKQGFPSTDDFWIYVNKTKSDRHLLYVELPQVGEISSISNGKPPVLCALASSSMPFDCLTELQSKGLHLVYCDYNVITRELELNICALECMTTELKFSSEAPKPRKSHVAVQTLMSHLYGMSLPDYRNPFNKKHDIEGFFRIVKDFHLKEGCSVKAVVQHPSLKPCLRAYQRAAVLWMLEREGYHTSRGETGKADTVELEKLHPLYTEVLLPDGQTIYYNKHGGYLVRCPPKYTTSSPGGILADEMGLGKTVEVLACMLCHPRKWGLKELEILPVLEKETEVDIPVCIATQPTDDDSVSQKNAGTIEDEITDVGTNESDKINSMNMANNIEEEIVQTTSREDGGCSQECVKDLLASHEPDEPKLHDHDYLAELIVLHDVPSVAMETVINAQEDSENVNSNQMEVYDNSIRRKRKPRRLKTFGKRRKHDRKKSPGPGHSNTEIKTNLGNTQGKRVNHRSKQKQNNAQLVLIEDIPDPGYFSVGVFKAKSEFECVCGEMKLKDDDRITVCCEMCGTSQHAECVQYDLTDPYRGNYRCPHCHVSSNPIPSGATLIISPSSICHQWVNEVQKHVQEESIKVLVYTGVQKHGFIQPQSLANQDIVITTYETLRKEIDYVDLPHSNSEEGRRFRNAKRYMATPSPIVAVEWWRICLDEAQMVESTATKTADMALRLSAVNRWCVTGTPIQRGLEDLYGLLLFLGVDPYWVHLWWNKILYQPYCYGDQSALNEVVGKAMWRTSKQDVLEQIGLPPQTEEMHKLTFSPVEEHFYRRQYLSCAREAMQRLSKWADNQMKLSSLDRYTLQQLLTPLVRLRQACCHPQAVRGEFVPLHKTTLTMGELLQQLIKKARMECEEAQRQFVMAMNGLAALHICREQFNEAIDKYREVLYAIEEHKGKVRTDELQQLHTLHNLQELLLNPPPGVAPTLRDSQLTQQAGEIRQKYLLRFTNQVVQAETAWHPVRKSLRDQTNEFSEGRDWWAGLIQGTMSSGMDERLIEKLQDDMSENSNPDISMAFRFRDARGLQYLLSTQLEQLQNSHDALVMVLVKLHGHPSPTLVNQTVECCLRPEKDKILKICPFCKAHDMFEEYESKLFSFVEKGMTEYGGGEEEVGGVQVSTRRQGTWADSELEKALKIIVSFCRTWGGDRNLVEYGSMHIKILDTLKKEFKYLRTLWMYMREQVSAVDELNMATTRIRLRFPDEEKIDPPPPNILEKSELDQHKMKFETSKIIGKNDLRKRLGQLLYLQNLAKAGNVMDGGQNPEPCPICQKPLGTRWSVLQCGHCYCLECIRILVEQYSFGGRRANLKCPVCRDRTCHADISYVSTKQEFKEETHINVKGDHSTKVEGVIRCLLQIQKDDPAAKSLVFSTWQDILDVLSTALADNQIPFCSLHSNKHKFQKSLSDFRHLENIKVLLLPVHSGSNGLNLVEATHILLVEPILNPAQELQAIGRIHRIGQSKATVVHRFLVQGTIEERMHTLLATVAAPVNSHSTVDTELTIGELSSLFQDVRREEDEAEEEDIDMDAEAQGGLNGLQDGPSGPHEGPSGSNEGPSRSNEEPSGSNERPSGSNEGLSRSYGRSSGSNKGLSDSNEGLSGSNEGLHGSNEGLGRSYERSNEGLHWSNEGLYRSNEGSNEGLSCSNEGPIGSNEGPIGSNEGPIGSNEGLSDSNEGLSGSNEGVHGSNEELCKSNEGSNEGLSGSNEGPSGSN